MILSISLTILLAELCYSALHSHGSFHPLENYNSDLFEGDILLRNGTFGKDRYATTHKGLRWPNGIVPYILDEIYSESDIELIRSTMDKFEKHTCIKWVERTDEDDYVEIYSDMGCFSELGKVGGVQSLSLESDTCMKKGVILHEMMHSLGFLHEQTRYDRDDHVRVLWDNIVPGMEPNFSKMRPSEIDLLDLGYDYESIMHYGAYMFALDRSLPTLKPSNEHVPLRQLGYGQAQGVFSELDIQKINKFYECDLQTNVSS
ncbi:zinc metalloproteinase nas-15-like [Argiope bruennichi]|uniref:zinc metalloproteinase nas-15-like n=1 Tax=Argiope bruennichi TaxID=94029 RepID=UPI00249589E0|nr:zinc metalloproteinase nas-15-like [Argiope bruennichi]